MKQKPSSRRRRNSTKSILRLPDPEYVKAAVLNSLGAESIGPSLIWSAREATFRTVPVPDWVRSETGGLARRSRN
jgi:hypothetical protein